MFETARFYRRISDGVVYRCEQAKDSRVLLHIADKRSQVAAEERLVLRDVVERDWEQVPLDEEPLYLETYARDLADEYGPIHPQSALFRRQYHFDRYLTGVADVEIRERMAAIASNAVCTNDNGDVLPSLNPMYWQRLMEELAEHLFIERRAAFFDLNADGNLVIRLQTEIDPKKQVPWGKIPGPKRRTPGDLFKFGKAKHLAAALSHGEFRVAAASTYSDPSLNVARNDRDEGSLVLRPSATGFRVVVEHESSGLLLDSVAPRNHQVMIQIGGDRDFYVWCASKAYEARLYADFDADACLVIHDVGEFARRMNSGLFAADPRAVGMFGGEVKYYDTLRPDDLAGDIHKTPKSLYLNKEFKYAYQAEYRLVWPLGKGMAATHVDIVLGPMHEICELILLNAP